MKAQRLKLVLNPGAAELFHWRWLVLIWCNVVWNAFFFIYMYRVLWNGFSERAEKLNPVSSASLMSWTSNRNASYGFKAEKWVLRWSWRGSSSPRWDLLGRFYVEQPEPGRFPLLSPPTFVIDAWYSTSCLVMKKTLQPTLMVLCVFYRFHQHDQYSPSSLDSGSSRFNTAAFQGRCTRRKRFWS